MCDTAPADGASCRRAIWRNLNASITRSCHSVVEYTTRTMAEERRGRPTLRCLVDDLGVDLPGLDVDLGELSNEWLNELRRIAPTSPLGQKRILSIDHPMVYRLRVSTHRGATWLHEGPEIVWLCGAHKHEDGSEDDAYIWFAGLHASNRLLPDDDDRLRDRAEAVLRFHKLLTAELCALVDSARTKPSEEVAAELGGWITCRVLVVRHPGMDEIWCALSTHGNDDGFVSERQRDLLFAELERHLGVEIEPCYEWPTGDLKWFEVVRFGLC